MQQFRLECPCGYESNSAPFGSDVWSSTYFVPVVVLDDETLHGVEIEKHTNESEDEFDKRLDESIRSQVFLEFGECATIMTPSSLRENQAVTCPKCGEKKARFQFVGF